MAGAHPHSETERAIPSREIPAIDELARLRKWVSWKYATRDGRVTKIPIMPDGSAASVTDPSTWSSFEECGSAALQGTGEGPGFVLALGDGYVGGDLDKCVKPDGSIEPWAAEIVKECNTYTEVSPSGRGLRFVARGRLPQGGRKRGQVEVYDDTRYLTITGRHLRGTPDTIEERTAELAAVHAWVFGKPRTNGSGRVEYERGEGWDGELPEAVAALAGKNERIRRLLEERHEVLDYPSESEADLALAASLVLHGLPGAEIEATLLWRRRGDGKDAQYFRRTVERALAGARDHHDEGPTDQTDDDPNAAAGAAQILTIELADRQLDDIIDDSVEAILQANNPPSLFMRGGTVVSIAADEHGSAIIRELTEAALVDRLAGSARWLRGKGESGPSKTLASVVLPRLLRLDSDSALPALRGVTESPILRADGSLLERPGYDPVTRLVHAPEPGFSLPPVPRIPTEPELRAAVAVVEDILRDFPFATNADLATAWAALFTIALRTMIEGALTPLFLFDAPAPGTGKGLLARALGQAATGARPPMMSAPGDRDDAEWRKRVTATLFLGRSLAIIDNVEQPIGSPALAALLTTDTWTDRILGRSEMVTLAARTVWIVTGNNLRLRGDLPRRAVWCRLDAQLARPWVRDGFHHADLLGWVSDNRSQLLGAVFTIARSWISAGRPGPPESVPKLGSFEVWRETIGGILYSIGIKDFLGNLGSLYDALDDETPAWAAFLSVLRKTYVNTAFTVAQIMKVILASQESELRAVLPADLASALEKPESLARRLGKAFARRVDTRFVVEGGTTMRLIRDGTAHHAGRWKVVGE